VDLAATASSDDALIVVSLLAVNPRGLRGASLRSLSSPERDRFVNVLSGLMPDSAPFLKVPVSVGIDRLLGGLDFAATVAAGSPVYSTGLVEAAHGGVLCLAMAERLEEGTAAIIAQVLDQHRVLIERDGVGLSRPSEFIAIAFDEGLEPEEQVNPALKDRLAFELSVEQLAPTGTRMAPPEAAVIAAARERLPAVRVADDIFEMLVGVALAFGIGSVRAELLAMEAARASAALAGREDVSEADAALAARLVFSTRATRLPADESEAERPDEVPDGEEPAENRGKQDALPEDMVVDAVKAAIPRGLLELLASDRPRRAGSSGGRSSTRTRSTRRGRPVGVRPSTDLAAARLNILATLKAAAPWQTLRRQSGPPGDAGLALRKEDLHVTRYEDNVETSTIFVVDASGSQAAQRLAEVKGAIELLLNDCYVRRDQVALIAFRGERAETLLPPTRALARVKRSLSALPGGGATPLAAGLDAARDLATSIGRLGRVPAIVLLTDGRANVARDGSTGSELATSDAIQSARLLRAGQFRSLLVDTSRRPRPRARELAAEMGAEYVPLPFADAASISASVQQGVK
jgi:magnesium chelatase subunit D